MNAAIVDLDKYALVEMQGHVLTGECNRCGECCKVSPPYPKADGTCEHLISDELNDAGEPLFRCAIYFKRPVGCALWPDLDDPVPDECGLAWQKKTQETKA